MEFILSLAIGALAGCGVWLLLRPRTFQVIMGLVLLSYAVNLFILGVGTAAGRHAALPRKGPDRRSRAIRRSLAASSRPHGDRHQFCDDRLVPGRPAGLAGTDRHRPCRRHGAGSVTRWLDHLLILPVVLPLVAGAVMLLIDEQHRTLKTAISIGTVVALTGVALALLLLWTRRRRSWIRSRVGLSSGRLAGAICNRAGRRPPLGADAGSDERAGSRLDRILGRSLGPGRSPFPRHVPVPVDGFERRFSDRRPLQPLRLVRTAAGGVLRPCAAWIGHAPRQGRVALHRRQSGDLPAVSDRRELDLRRDRHAQHGRPRHPDSASLRRKQRAAGSGRGRARDRISGEGRHVAAELLVADSLFRGRSAGCGHVLDHEQARHLCGVAALAVAVRGG